MLAAWRDPTFRYYRAANLLLRGSVALFRAGLIPRSALAYVLLWSQALAGRGARLLRRRRSNKGSAGR